MSIFKKDRIASLKTEKTDEHEHTVLIVDDEANNLHVLKTVLEDQYEVLTAASGFEALEVIQHAKNPEQINLIISDQRMPGMSGVEFLEKTISLIPHSVRIILTGYTDVEDVIDAINRGRIYQYVIKPFERRELLLTVQRAIESYKREQQVRHLALHDPLTGLPNRALFQDRLSQYAAMSKRHDVPLAVFIMDLINFKAINDTFGHEAGDQLLQQISERLVETMRESDTVSRLGGDEFALITPNVSEREVDLVAQRILNIFQQTFDVAGSQFEIAPSIGVAIFPSHCEDASMLIQRADIAMYAAKGASESYAIYTPEQGKTNETRLQLINDLKKAIDSQEFMLEFQPVVDLETHSISHIEALVRWKHSKHGLIAPKELIPLVEYTGKLSYLTNWIFEQSIAQLGRWHASGYQLKLSVNLSDMDLLNKSLPDTVKNALSTFDVDAESLILEFSERGLSRSPTHITRALQTMRDFGVTISLDDFGTGYTSIMQLRKLPISELKIDQSFLASLFDDEDSPVIVESAIQLGHNLGLKVTAEGIETPETLSRMKELGCDRAQGFHIAEPMNASDLINWLKTSDYDITK